MSAPRVIHGDCIEVMRGLPDASVDAVVTDPPYGLEFMGKEWDAPWKPSGAVIHDPATERGGFQDGNGGNPYSRSRIEYGRGGAASVGFQQWCELWATECLRVLKPGGHLLAFGGTRTYHRLACAVEDAGFEVRDSIAWLYGSGFPKSLDVSKAIDKAAGAERQVVEERVTPWRVDAAAERASSYGEFTTKQQRDGYRVDRITAPATDAARTWQGWGTALKPAFEPIVVARKPLTGTVAANVLSHGTGALNVDGCRIGETVETWPATRARPLNSRDMHHNYVDGGSETVATGAAPAGRWPANVVLDESQAAELDQQSGELVDRNGGRGGWREEFVGGDRTADRDTPTYRGEGGASRFFYIAKADASERVRLPKPGTEGKGQAGVHNNRCGKCGRTDLSGTPCVCPEPEWIPRTGGDVIAHPTVKPLALMRWLVRLVTPPGGTVLEPFAGSGTTVEACILEGFPCIAIEREADYLPLIQQRIDRRRDPVAAVKASGDDAGLFDLLGEETA